MTLSAHRVTMTIPTVRFTLALLLVSRPALAQQPTPAPTVRPGTPDTSPFRPLELAPPNEYRSASGLPGPAYWQQQADYTIRASLDTATHTIRGEETIRSGPARSPASAPAPRSSASWPRTPRPAPGPRPCRSPGASIAP